MTPLSILDLSPVSAGSTGAQALRHSLDLAQLADGLGFTRHWLAAAPHIHAHAPPDGVRRRQGTREGDAFLERFNELMLLESRGFPAGHPFHNVRAMPSDVPLPPIFLLGSSDYSAQLAGQIGAAFAFAHHFATFDAAAAMRLS